MDVFVVAIRGIIVEEITEPGNRRLFGNSCVYMLNSSEVICDKYPSGFTINYVIDSLSVTLIQAKMSKNPPVHGTITLFPRSEQCDNVYHT